MPPQRIKIIKVQRGRRGKSHQPPLSLSKGAQKRLDRLAHRLGGDALVPAQADGGPFLLEALGGRPVRLVLDDDERAETP